MTEQQITKCSNCKKKYKTNEDNFDVYFGYKAHDVPFKTCIKCRGKNKPKIKCPHCQLDILPEEEHMHKQSVYCRSIRYEQARTNCDVCCDKKSSCGRCKWIWAAYEPLVKYYTDNPEENVKAQKENEEINKIMLNLT